MAKFTLLISFLLASLLCLHAEESNKKTIVPVLLPDGKPAKNLTLTIHSRSLVLHQKINNKTVNFQTNEKGELHLTKEWMNRIQALVIDAPGYALHIQAYTPLEKIQLNKDSGFEGILVDKKNQPIKNANICVSQSIGLIWGSIWIPKGINQATTNDKGEFRIRQMVLNDIKHYNCSADIQRVGKQPDQPRSLPTMGLQFSGPSYKQPAKPVLVTLEE